MCKERIEKAKADWKANKIPVCVVDATGNAALRNEANGNAGWGIYVSGPSAVGFNIDGGYNSAQGNAELTLANRSNEPLRVTLRDGVATPTGPQGSHQLRSMVGADGLVGVPTREFDVPPGLEGRVRASSIKKIGEIVEKHPERVTYVHLKSVDPAVRARASAALETPTISSWASLSRFDISASTAAP